MIREDITDQDQINALRLDIENPIREQEVYVCFEGETDVQLFRKFFNRDNCRLEYVPGGKSGVEKFVTDRSGKIPLTIGIRDADFLHLENKIPSHPNIFLTDCHDMEMNMISVEEVFSSILFEFTNLKQEEHGAVRDNILKAISFIGYFKLLNEIEKLEINFEGIDFDKLIDIQTFEIDKKTLIDTALNQSPNTKERNTSILLGKINSIISVRHNLYQLCNGHDFMKVLSVYLKPMKQVKPSDLESQFRTTYTLQHYQSTNLYKNTLNWATENNCKLY
jgi:hypothetical protein